MGNVLFNDNHKNCECEICKNSKEERQFALWGFKDSKILMDCEELSHIFNFFEDKESIDKIKTQWVDEAKKAPVLAYGVAIPCNDDSTEKLKEELFKFKNYAHSCLDSMTEYVSVYEDIEVFDKDVVYMNHVPVACLIQTDLALDKAKPYNFGYTIYLKLGNEDLTIFDNILNRKYLLCLKGIEETFDCADKDNWKKYINKNRAIQIAKELL